MLTALLDPRTMLDVLSVSRLASAAADGILQTRDVHRGLPEPAFTGHRAGFTLAPCPALFHRTSRT